MKISENKKRIFSTTTLIISLLIPVFSAAQSTSNQSLTQQLTGNSYTFTTPDNFSFDPIFLSPNATTSVQNVMDPTTSGELVKFTDLRGSDGGAFSINAYMSDFTDGRTTIDYENIGIATRANDATYSVDMHASNSISAANERVQAPLDYTGSLTNGQIPSNSYTTFSTDTASTSRAITIMDGSLPTGEVGRTGSFSLAPAIIINIPANKYGDLIGTLTLELILS